VKPKEIGVMLEEKYSVYLSLLFERISRWAFGGLNDVLIEVTIQPKQSEN